jgi:hypothetical protein
MTHINKTSLLVSLLFFLATVFAEINLPQEFTCEGFKLYNSLPEVELADQELQKTRSFDQFLGEAQKLAQRYNLEESMGIRLIHRHTTINDNEIMIEQQEVFEGQDALVTRPQSNVYETKAAPASWIFDGEQYHVFEYSDDAHVSKAFEKVRTSSDFLNEFASLLKKYDYQSLIALAITDREWYLNYEDKHSFLERSYDKPTFASVVVNVHELEDVKAIKTEWVFKKISLDKGCRRICGGDSGHTRSHYN